MMASERFKFLSGLQILTLLRRLTGLRRWRRSPATKTRRYVNVAGKCLPWSGDSINIVTLSAVTEAAETISYEEVMGEQNNFS